MKNLSVLDTYIHTQYYLLCFFSDWLFTLHVRILHLSLGFNNVLFDIVSDRFACDPHLVHGLRVFEKRHQPRQKIDCPSVIDFPKDFIEAVAVVSESFVTVLASLDGTKVAVENVGASLGYQRFQIDQVAFGGLFNFFV